MAGRAPVELARQGDYRRVCIHSAGPYFTAPLVHLVQNKTAVPREALLKGELGPTEAFRASRRQGTALEKYVRDTAHTLHRKTSS